MDPQDIQNTTSQDQTNQQDDPSVGFVPIGGPVGEGFVEIVPEKQPAVPETLPVQEIYTVPTRQRPISQQLPNTPTTASTSAQATTPKVVNKATSKEHLHTVGQNADSITKLADEEETQFIEQVEEHHKPN